MKNLTFSFDIGYASIGWAALQETPEVKVAGTGVVLFPSDECLASKRRQYRRMRRTIRSRRQRIDRIGKILEHHGVITHEQRLQLGHPAPFVLAARALSGKIQLSGLEVWHLMRWYAHNRGYDGNVGWSKNDPSRVDEQNEDTEKVEAAKARMKEFGTSTMAETLVRILELKGEKIASTRAFKSLNMAFPRDVVCEEVQRLLAASTLPEKVRALIMEDASEHIAELAECGVRLPRRYQGSILFGQLIPRFDNRIIARCPITWAKEYADAKAEGMDEKQAKAKADKYAKVPNADSREFYEYRFARILANIRVEGRPLPAEQRRQLMDKARECGKFNKTSFREAVRSVTGGAKDNLYNFFQVHPDSEKALVIVPPSKKEKATGRAPYARPVLRQVVEEILRGEDATRPARSLEHPDGEDKAQDGVLYALLDPNSEVSRVQAVRRVEDMSNNHLVRHRMLIFKRLLLDMIKKYADGDPTQVKRFCIEVGRELSEFSGMTSYDIKMELGKRMKNFNDAVKHLNDNAPDLPLSAGLIRKCRIAMDLGWTCPFTGKKYGAYDLPKLQREHVVPFANRHSNAMASLVLTWPEVNKMKGKRTGLQFVTEEGGREVLGMNATIVTKKRYEDFVTKLDTKGAPDDMRRKKRRKQLMLVDALPKSSEREENLGFTDGLMTQSSHLMKIAAHVARGVCKKAQVAMIPGSVTAAVRASWNAWSALAEVCPSIRGGAGRLLDKEAIRGITHLHHALDASVLGLIPLLIPAGTNGMVWQALALRHLTERQVEQLRQLGGRKVFKLDQDRRLHLDPLPDDVRRSLAAALKEERVVTHVPADMSGARLEETTWGVLGKENGKIKLRQRSIQQVHPDGARQRKVEEKNVAELKLLGITPAGTSKLKSIGGARIISENYGLALTPVPVVIPHHDVYRRLRQLSQNGHLRFQVLRVGQLIKVEGYHKPPRNRVWRVASVKNSKKGLKLDLQAPSSSRKIGDKCSDNWREVLLKTLQTKCRFSIVDPSYVGVGANED